MKAAFNRFMARLRTEQQELWRVIEVVRLGARRLWQSGIPRMAAALSYRTIFSLVPVLVVGVVVIGSFATEDQMRAQIQRLVEFAGLDSIAVDEGPSPEDVIGGGAETVESASAEIADVGSDSGSDPSLGATPEDPVVAGSEALISDSNAKQRLDEWITDLVTRVSSLPFGALGVVGVGFLVYAALSMLVELERAFNQIYGAPRSRNLIQMVVTYWTALTLGVVFLLGTFYAGDAVAAWAVTLGQEAATVGEGGVPGSPAATQGWISPKVLEVLINLVINIGLLFFVYTAVPNTRVAFRPAFAGAVVAGVAWQLGKSGFTLYVQNFTGGLEQLYGAIALIPLFLLWVYVTWIIVLFGLQVSHSVQTFSVWAASDDDSDAPRLADPGLVLVVAVAVARRFAKGDRSEVGEIAHEVAAEERVVRIMLDRLVDRGLVHRVVNGRDERAYALARSPDLIAAADVLRAGETLTGAAQGGLVGDLARARIDAAGDRSLADVAAGGLFGARAAKAAAVEAVVEDDGPATALA
ncbi:MAG: YihY/virulence factor BrkB family protein [Planctomycetota bacterium]